MANTKVYTEKRRRESVRTMLRQVCDAISDPGNESEPSWTRRELFDVKELDQDYAEKSFQTRLLQRFCDIGVFERAPESRSNSLVFRVRDASRLLRALDDETTLSGLIWAREDILRDLSQAPAEDPVLPPSPSGDTSVSAAPPTEPVEPAGAPPDESAQEPETLPSSQEMQAAVLKIVFGLVENMTYLRTEIAALATKMDTMLHAMEINSGGHLKPDSDTQPHQPPHA